MSEPVDLARAAFGVAEEAWREAREGWRDEVAAKFETEHWEPLAGIMDDLLHALQAAMDAADEAERVCHRR